jgi:hypothetical protein
MALMLFLFITFNVEAFDSRVLSLYSNNSCSVDGNNDLTLEQRCALDLCGTPKLYDSVHLTNAIFENEIANSRIDKEYYEQYVPKLKEYIKSQRERVSKFADKILSDPTLWQKKKFTLDGMEDYEKSSIIMNIFLNNFGFKIDKTSNQYKFEVQFYKDGEYEKNKEEYDKLIEIKKWNLQNNLWEMLSYDVIDKEEAQKLLLEDALKVKNMVSENKQDLVKVEEIIKKIKDDSSEDKFSTGNYANDLYSLWDKLAVNGQKNFQDRKNIDCVIEKEICNKLIKRTLDEFKAEEKAKELLKYFEKEDYEEELIQSCRFKFYNDSFDKADLIEIVGFKKKLPSIRDLLKNKYLARYSVKTQVKLKEKVDSVNDTIAQELAEFKKKNETYWDAKKSFISLINEERDLDLDNIFSSFTSLYYEMQNYTLFTSDESLNPFSTLHCDAQGLYFASDYYDDGGHMIHSSGYSAKYPRVGSRIYHHELGHVISDVMNSSSGISKESFERFKKDWSCVDSQRLSEAVEEDFADHVTFSTNIDSGYLMFCSGLKQSEDRKSYIDVTVKNSDPT